MNDKYSHVNISMKNTSTFYLLFHLILVTFLLDLEANTPIVSVSPKIQKAIIDYLENDYFYQNDNYYFVPDENKNHRRAFSYCDFFGMKRDDIASYRVFIKSFCFTYYLKYDQIFEDACNCVGLFVVKVKETGSGFEINIVDPNDTPKSNENLKKMIPIELQDKMFSTEDNSHMYYDRMQECKKRVMKYYKPLLSKDHYFYQKPPKNQSNPHRHQSNVYNYLNVKKTFSYITIKEVSRDSTKELASEPIFSQDRRFRVWQGLEYDFHLYFEDRKKKQIFEIVRPSRFMLMREEFKDKKTLVFDQVNGFNRFDTTTKNTIDDFGVHIEIDLAKREVSWAVPFGTLSFPETINNF